jgi:hypothetical protein
MPRSPFARVLSASERLYQVLLLAYPPAYRREYGHLMAQAYRDLCRDTYRQKGMVGMVALWFRVLADLATSFIVQHLDALREGGLMMTRKEHALATAAATLPLGIWAVLGLVNPRFAGHMFVRSPAQPLGWIMIAAVFLLVGIAYFCQRKAFGLSSQVNSSDRTAGRRVLRDTLRVGSVALFVLPAILLVVLGPALMMVLSRTAGILQSR